MKHEKSDVAGMSRKKTILVFLNINPYSSHVLFLT